MVVETRRASKANNSNANPTPSCIPTAVNEMDIQMQLNLEYPDSPLSDPPSSLTSPEHAPDAEYDGDIDMISPTRSSSSSDSDSNDDYYLSDSSTTARHTPQLVEAIEHELGITRLQGNRLRDLIAAQMRDNNLLGELNFKTNKAQGKKELRPIFARVLEVDFVVCEGLSKKRMGELLLSRAMVVNRNEAHNRYMVTTDRVKRRADGTEYVPGDDVEEEEASRLDKDAQGVQPVAENDDEVAGLFEDLQQTPNNHAMMVDEPENQHAAEHEAVPINASPSMDGTAARPSVVAANLGNLSLDGINAQPEHVEDAALGSPVQLEGYEPQAKAQEFTKPINPKPEAAIETAFYPKTFIVRVAGSTIGTAVHISQLIDPAQTTPLAAEDVSFEQFIQVVSRQLGFKVEGRISAALPRFHKFLPENSLVLLGSEATWIAVLQAWHNSRRRLCEFVVEKDGMQE